MYVWYYLTILKCKFSHTKAPDWINDKDLTGETSNRVKVGGRTASKQALTQSESVHRLMSSN